MKNLFAVAALVLGLFGPVAAQNNKPENLSALKKDADFFAKVYAREIATEVGLNKDQETQVTEVYKDYNIKATALRKNNPSMLETQLPKLQNERDQKIKSYMTPKQKEKFEDYLKKQQKTGSF